MGTRSLYIFGILLNGICPTLFGFLHFISSPTLFMSIAVLLRGIEGIGNCFIQIPGFMIVNQSFPGRTSSTAAVSDCR